MTAIGVTSDSQITRISLAVLKDTNWYVDVNIDMGEVFKYFKVNLI